MNDINKIFTKIITMSWYYKFEFNQYDLHDKTKPTLKIRRRKKFLRNQSLLSKADVKLSYLYRQQ